MQREKDRIKRIRKYISKSFASIPLVPMCGLGMSGILASSNVNYEHHLVVSFITVHNLCCC